MVTDQVFPEESAGTQWRPLYLAGAVAALLTALLFRRNCGAELSLLNMMGFLDIVPTTIPMRAQDWFILMQDNSLVGLIMFRLFDLVNFALLGLIFLALYGALRRLNPRAINAALALAVCGLIIAVVTNQALAMYALSRHYAAAVDETTRNRFLAAGEALLAIDNPEVVFQGGGLFLGFFLVTVAGLIISIVMLRSLDFGRATAVIGILAYGLDLCLFPTIVLAPALAWLFPTLSATFRLLWSVLIARDLLRLSRGPTPAG